MATTGERYTVARQALIEQANRRPKHWVSDPETSDQAVRKATGNGWDDWVAIIKAWPGHLEGHTAIAAHLDATYNIGGWWAQAVTVGYERITGLRLPHQMADGTFTANKSRTVPVDAATLRTLLLDDNERHDLLGVMSECRSKPEAKTPRFAIGDEGKDGSARFEVTEVGKNKAKVTIQHAKLASLEDVEKWRFYWNDWLAALEGKDS